MNFGDLSHCKPEHAGNGQKINTSTSEYSIDFQMTEIFMALHIRCRHGRLMGILMEDPFYEHGFQGSEKKTLFTSIANYLSNYLKAPGWKGYQNPTYAEH